MKARILSCLLLLYSSSAWAKDIKQLLVCATPLTNASKQPVSLTVMNRAMISALEYQKVTARLLEDGSPNASRPGCDYALSAEIRVVRQISAGHQLPSRGVPDTGSTVRRPGEDETYYVETFFTLRSTGNSTVLVSSTVSATSLDDWNEAVRETLDRIAARVRHELQQ